MPCEVVMPLGAPVTKVEATEALGAHVILEGDGVDDCLVTALRAGDASAARPSCTRSRTPT